MLVFSEMETCATDFPRSTFGKYAQLEVKVFQPEARPDDFQFDRLRVEPIPAHD